MDFEYLVFILSLSLFKIELRHLQSLCRRRGATEKEIQSCAPEGN